nr:immunoglobulin heavy chain junction region [Macaca mulatta]MOV35924.1 immunoglobulin heavy chain junction region [Macaca mulatta]MOV35947.1 immunoglobulin heavy chain junction region [Macaca mulatta]MOV35955.1 immunoglobulin heavy chain junction region [Macaca mulatta]MOV36028.1 immunoglobulin heavy chain junction region [Macaca mulatta]
CATLKYW